MTISLHDIEKAIRANFIIDPAGKRLLETTSEWESGSINVGRLVFVGVAVEREKQMEEICAYLDMTYKEYKGKFIRYVSFMKSGEVKYDNMRKRITSYSQSDVDTIDLRVYRKTLLINSYLDNMLQRKSYEFIRALADDFL